MDSTRLGPTIVEVYADIWCPFAHVGLRRFVERRAAAGRSDLRLLVRAWPLELINGAPLDPQLVADEVVDLRSQVAPDLFLGLQPTTFPTTTLPALDLVQDAYSGGLDLGEHASLAVRDAVFEQGLDIADPGVLASLRARLGVGPPSADARARVLSDYQRGRALGVIGSPHFFVGDEGFFCPRLRIERQGEHLHIELDGDAFDAFFDRCLAPRAA